MDTGRRQAFCRLPAVSYTHLDVYKRQIQELLTADPQATLDEFKDKSMKEIKVHTEHCEHRQRRIRGELQGQSQAESSQAESQEESQAESSQADFQGESQADFQDKFPDNSSEPAERSHSQTCLLYTSRCV